MSKPGNREANYFNVGLQGRKTGVVLNENTTKDEDGFDDLDCIFETARPLTMFSDTELIYKPVFVTSSGSIGTSHDLHTSNNQLKSTKVFQSEPIQTLDYPKKLSPSKAKPISSISRDCSERSQMDIVSPASSVSISEILKHKDLSISNKEKRTENTSKLNSNSGSCSPNPKRSDKLASPILDFDTQFSTELIESSMDKPEEKIPENSRHLACQNLGQTTNKDIPEDLNQDNNLPDSHSPGLNLYSKKKKPNYKLPLAKRTLKPKTLNQKPSLGRRSGKLVKKTKEFQTKYSKSSTSNATNKKTISDAAHVLNKEFPILSQSHEYGDSLTKSTALSNTKNLLDNATEIIPDAALDKKDNAPKASISAQPPKPKTKKSSSQATKEIDPDINRRTKISLSQSENQKSKPKSKSPSEKHSLSSSKTTEKQTVKPSILKPKTNIQKSLVQSNDKTNTNETTNIKSSTLLKPKAQKRPLKAPKISVDTYPVLSQQDVQSENEETGLRRSKRPRYGRLKFWANEKVDYEWIETPNGPVQQLKVIRVSSPVRSKSSKHKSSKNSKAPLSNASKVYNNICADSTEYPVSVVSNDSKVFPWPGVHFDKSQWGSVDQSDNGNYVVLKQNNETTSGFIDVTPGGSYSITSKDEGVSAYYLIYGNLSANINAKSHSLSPGTHILVRPRTSLRLTNDSSSIARVFYVDLLS